VRCGRIAPFKTAEHMAELVQRFGWAPSRRGGSAPPPQSELSQWRLFDSPAPIGNHLRGGRARSPRPEPEPAPPEPLARADGYWGEIYPDDIAFHGGRGGGGVLYYRSSVIWQSEDSKSIPFLSSPAQKVSTSKERSGCAVGYENDVRLSDDKKWLERLGDYKFATKRHMPNSPASMARQPGMRRSVLELIRNPEPVLIKAPATRAKEEAEAQLGVLQAQVANLEAKLRDNR